MIDWLLSLDWPSALIGLEVAAAIVFVALDVRETLGYQRRWAKAAGDDPRYWFIRPVRRIGIFITLLGAYLLLLTAIAVFGISISSVPWIRPVNGLFFLGLLAIPWVTGKAMRARVAANGEPEP